MLQFNKRMIFSTEPLVWFASKFALLAHSVFLAKKWPAVMVEWHRIEQMLPPCIVKKRKITPFTQINLIVIIIPVAAIS